VNITYIRNIENIGSYDKGGFMYLDNPNVKVNMDQTELNEIFALNYGGSFYVARGKEIILDKVSFFQPNGTNGAVMYSEAPGFYFNMTSSEVSCGTRHFEDEIFSHLDTTVITDNPPLPKIKDYYSIFYIKSAEYVRSEDNQFRYCIV